MLTLVGEKCLYRDLHIGYTGWKYVDVKTDTIPWIKHPRAGTLGPVFIWYDHTLINSAADLTTNYLIIKEGVCVCIPIAHKNI